MIDDTKTKIVHKVNKDWYFWNETWTTRNGPYKTKEEAEQAVYEYTRTLLK